MGYGPFRIHNPLPGHIVIVEMVIYLPLLVILVFLA